MADSAQPLPELLPGLLEAVTTVAKLELPDPSDILYYRNIPEYKELSAAASGQVQQLLRTARSSLTRPTGPVSAAAAATAGVDDDDADEAMFSDLVAVLDDTLERLDVALDAAQQQTEQLKLGGWAPAASRQQALRVAGKGPGGSASVAGFSRGRVQRHVANLARPQESFPDPVDNSNSPWEPSRHPHLAARLAAAAQAAAAAATADPLAAHAAQLTAAGSAGASRAAAPHPCAAELAALVYQPWQLAAPELPLSAAADFDSVPFSFVDSAEGLADMVAALAVEQQVALDLEHHAYRSFQGFTCLLQVSTRSADWVVDALALRDQLGPALAAVLADPSVEKVLHGADSDVLWLQRDFGLYLVNLFDTGQAARVLNYPSASLAHLLERHCGFKPDKRYQLADWRVRPLSPDMLHYARADTHFLLAAADALRAELAVAGQRVPAGWAVPVPQHSGAQQDALGVVLERSRLICTTTYQKPLLSEASYLDAAARWGLALPPANMAVFGAFYAWRDATARSLDESVSYVMPKAALLELSRAAPQTAGDVRRVLGAGSGLTGGSGLLLARAEEVAAVVRAGLQQAPAAKTAAAAAAERGPAAEGSEAEAGAAAAAAAPVKPRELPPVKPKALPALASAKRAAAGRAGAAGGLRGAVGGGRGVGQAATAATAAAAPPAVEQVAAVQPAEQPEQQQQEHRQQEQQAAQQQQQQHADCTPAEQTGQDQGSEQQLLGQQQAQQQQEQEARQLSDSVAAAAPAPKQLAPPRISNRRRGSSLAGLLAAKPRKQQQPQQPQPQQQQQQPAIKAAALKATSFKLDFMSGLGSFAPAAAAASAPEQQAEQEAEQQQQQQQGQQQQQEEEDGEQAAAPAVTGAQVRALVDQLMQDTAAEEDTAAAAQPGSEQESDEEGGGSDDGAAAVAAAAAARGAPAGLADLDYVPLSAQVKPKQGNRRKRQAGGGGQDGPAAKHQKAPQPASGNSQDEEQQRPLSQQQQEQQQWKRKHGIFDTFAGSGSGSSSDDELGPGGMLPAHDPSAAAAAGRHRQQAAGRDHQHDAAAAAAGAAAAGRGDRQREDAGRGRGGRGRGGRGGGGRGRRGGRSKRGGFMADAAASLAAVRRSQGGGVGANPFAIPDSNLLRGGKRSSVVPRGGNRSASFK